MGRLRFCAQKWLLLSVFSYLLCSCTGSGSKVIKEGNLPAGEKSKAGDAFEEDAFLGNGDQNASGQRIENAAKAASGSILKANPSLSQIFFVNTKILNVRQGPSPKFKKVTTLKQGELVNISQIEKEWAKFGEGRWVALQYLKVSTP